MQSGLFNDVLQYQQADFAAGTTFTVSVNAGDFNLTGTGNNRILELRTGGSGTVTVTENGVVTGTAQFREIEAVRTVSGTGAANASGGQGNDTLDVSAISDALSPIPGSIGVLYNLTGRDFNTDGITGPFSLSDEARPFGTPAAVPANQVIGAGELHYSSNAQGIAGRAQASDFERAYGLQVDGVENFVSGNGNDIVIVDHNEANKNNTFRLGLGNDRVIYANNYADINGDGRADEESNVTVRVGTFAADPDITHQVIQTAGLVGGFNAIDTLIGVQVITLDGQTAQSTRGADVIDLVNLNGGVVNYLTGIPGAPAPNAQNAFPFAAESVYDAAGNQLLKIENIAELENVEGSAGNDLVIVASAADMANATTEGRDTGPATVVGDKDTVLPVLTWLEFDNPQTPRPLFNNVGQFTFDLKEGIDRVDYGNTVDGISVAVTRGTNVAQYVLVDAGAGDFSNYVGFGPGAGNVNDRVDQLDGVEQIIASQGDSILDLTGLNLIAGESAFEIVYGGVNNDLSNLAIDRVGYDVNINVTGANNTSSNLRTYGEYRDGTADGANDPLQPSAAWNRIEGGNSDERVFVGGQGTNAVVDRLNEDHTFNLRGSRIAAGNAGQGNSVQYGGYDLQAGGVTVTLNGITNFDPVLNTGGTFNLSATFVGLGGHPVTDALAGTHIITGNTQDNRTAAGQLLIEGAVSGNDAISLTNLLNGSTIIVGATGIGGSGEIRLVQAGTPDAAGNAIDNIVTFTGFEELRDDGTSNQLYSFLNIQTAAATLTLSDSVLDDHDAVGVNNQAINAFGAGANTISLAAINTALAFDFDVLDVTAVTNGNLTLVGQIVGVGNEPNPLEGTTDEVVVGALSLITDIQDFESVVLSEATVASGNTFVLDLDLGQIRQGSTTVNATGVTSLSAGGLVFEDSLNDSYLNPLDTAVSITAIDQAAVGVSLFGGNGDDTLVGGGGDDVIYGGLGADQLDGGVQAEVISYSLDDNTAILNGEQVAFAGVNLFLVGDIVGGEPVGDSREGVNLGIERLWNSGSAVFNNVAFDDVIDIRTSTDRLSIIVTFDTSAGDQALNVLDPLIVLDNVGNGVQIADFADGNDTFVYTDAAESTSTSTDVISNFTLGAGTDAIDVQALGLAFITTDVNVASTDANAVANLAAFLAAANTAFGGGDGAFVAGQVSTNANAVSWIAVDANEDGVFNAADDLVIQLAGVNAVDLANFDQTQVVF